MSSNDMDHMKLIISSGKSSLVLLINRMLTTACGSILLDGMAIDSIPRRVLRNGIITLPQHPFFEDEGTSFREALEIGNVDLGAASGQLCQHALEAVGLWSTVSELGGLGAEIKIGSFSHGQRQLFSLARAIVRARHHNSQLTDYHTAKGILILDEVNSSVDIETDQMIRDVIRREFSAYTIIYVAHRLETLLDADMVVVMEKGHIAEIGSPQELLAKGDSKFHDIWGEQAADTSLQGGSGREIPRLPSALEVGH